MTRAALRLLNSAVIGPVCIVDKKYVHETCQEVLRMTTEQILWNTDYLEATWRDPLAKPWASTLQSSVMVLMPSKTAERFFEDLKEWANNYEKECIVPDHQLAEEGTDILLVNAPEALNPYGQHSLTALMDD